MPRYVTEITSDDGNTYLIPQTGGTTDHTQLSNRDAANQHPIAAITGLQSDLDGKQPTLVSGTNIKTVNGQSLLGSGDISGLPSWFGTIVSSATEMDIPSSPDYQRVDTFNLPVGLWIVTFYVKYRTINGDGERSALITTDDYAGLERYHRSFVSAKALSDVRTTCVCTFLMNVTSAQENYYIDTFQNSGVTLSAAVGYHCTRIK